MIIRPSQVVLMVKNLPDNAGDKGLTPGLEDPLEESMPKHSITLAWRIYGQKSLVGYSSWGHKEMDTTLAI